MANPRPIATPALRGPHQKDETPHNLVPRPPIALQGFATEHEVDRPQYTLSTQRGALWATLDIIPLLLKSTTPNIRMVSNSAGRQSPGGSRSQTARKSPTENQVSRETGLDPSVSQFRGQSGHQ